TLGDAPITLPQWHVVAPRQIDQFFQCAMAQPRIGRITELAPHTHPENRRRFGLTRKATGQTILSQSSVTFAMALRSSMRLSSLHQSSIELSGRLLQMSPCEELCRTTQRLKVGRDSGVLDFRALDEISQFRVRPDETSREMQIRGVRY